jgi:hypothetical protein
MTDQINKKNLDEIVVEIQQEMLRTYKEDRGGIYGMGFAIQKINKKFRENYESDILYLSKSNLKPSGRQQPIYSK